MKQKKLNPKILITLIIVVGIVVLGIVAKTSLGESGTITSAGKSTIEVNPDYASVYFNIETEGENSSEASRKNSEIVEEAKISLMDLGINESQINTEKYNIRPQYDYSEDRERELVGYVASHTLKVKIDFENREMIGQAIDAGPKAGAGINHINFEIKESKKNEIKTDAIKQATEDARSKAKALAEGSGSRLASLKSLSSRDFHYEPWRAYDSESATSGGVASGKDIAKNINPSQKEVSASVEAVFRVK